MAILQRYRGFIEHPGDQKRESCRCTTVHCDVSHARKLRHSHVSEADGPSKLCSTAPTHLRAEAQLSLRNVNRISRGDRVAAIDRIAVASPNGLELMLVLAGPVGVKSDEDVRIPRRHSHGYDDTLVIRVPEELIVAIFIEGDVLGSERHAILKGNCRCRRCTDDGEACGRVRAEDSNQVRATAGGHRRLCGVLCTRGPARVNPCAKL